ATSTPTANPAIPAASAREFAPPSAGSPASPPPAPPPPPGLALSLARALVVAAITFTLVAGLTRACL
ncbi:MAG TPA: hypothetical protein VIK91_00410, partial [Nannocystis sp.]